MTKTGEVPFWEEDEPLDSVLRAFYKGDKDVTKKPDFLKGSDEDDDFYYCCDEHMSTGIQWVTDCPNL